MTKKSVKKNYLYNLLYEILLVVTPLITTPYISRVLGVEKIGVYSFTYSIASYFAIIAALGSTVYARREIAYNQDNIDNRSKIFWEIFIFRCITTIISIAIYFIYIMFVDKKIIYIIQGIYILSVALDITWFFQGMEEFKTVVIRNTIIKVISIILIFVLIKEDNDLIIYIFLLAFLPFVANLITWPLLLKKVKKLSIKKLQPFRHFKGTMSLFIPTIAAQVYLLLDKTMIGLFSSNAIENGYYEQTQKIVKICWTFVTTFSVVMLPRIANIFAKKDENELKKYMNKSFQIVWFLSSPIVFGLASIVNNLVPWFFGEEFEFVKVLLLIFCWIVFPIGISSVTGSQYLIATKQQKVYTKSIVIGAIVNFCLNLVLIPCYFSAGAAISSVISEVVIAIIQLLYLSKKSNIFNIANIFKLSVKYIVAGMIMFIVVRLISTIFDPSFINTFILIVIGSMVYFLVLLIERDQLFINIIFDIKNRFLKKYRKKELK